MVDGPLFDDIPLDHINMNFKKFANFFRELTLLDEKITELGSLDHAIKEAKARFERVSALEAELQARYDSIVDKALARVKEAENEAKALLGKARVKESEILASASDKHAQTIKNAELEASKITEKAEGEVKKAEADLSDSHSKRGQVEAEIAERAAKMAELTKIIEAKHAEHKAITDKHEKFLASIGAK